MPRLFNRKVEVRFDDNSLEQIDHVATTLGLSRAEFMRASVMATASHESSPEAPSSPGKPPLSVNEYHCMVSAAHRATGGAVSRVQAELCVAVTLKRLFGSCATG